MSKNNGKLLIALKNEHELPEDFDVLMNNRGITILRDISSVPDNDTVVLSDDLEYLRKHEKEQCCIALESSRTLPGSWPCIADPEYITEPFLRQILCHFKKVPFEIAETSRLIIRESIATDYPVLRPLLLAVQNELSDESYFRAYIETAYTLFGFGFWTVIEKETGQIAGWCGFYPGSAGGSGCPEKPGEPEGSENEEETDYAEDSLFLGYAILEKYRKKGYGTESCLAIIQYAREELGLSRILLTTERNNQASARLAEKLGFRKISDGEAGTGRKEACLEREDFSDREELSGREDLSIREDCSGRENPSNGEKNSEGEMVTYEWRDKKTEIS